MDNDRLYAYLRKQVSSLERGFPNSKYVYLVDLHLTVYLRVTKHYIRGLSMPCIDIANVSVEDEFQKQGNFSQFIAMMKMIALGTQRVLRVESVVNPFLGDWLLRHGFEPEAEESEDENYVFNV